MKLHFDLGTPLLARTSLTPRRGEGSGQPSTQRGRPVTPVERLKGLGGQRGLKFKEYRVVGPLRYGAVDCGQDGLFHQSPPQEWQAAREASAPRGPRGVFGIGGVRVSWTLQPEPGQ